MAAALQNNLKPMTFEEYLAWEDLQPTKHEYHAGRVLAMAGGSVPHGTVAGNVFAALKGQLRGGRCRVYNSDIKLLPNDASNGYYPDVTVSCHFRDHNSTKHLSHPSLIVEVLSPTTAAFDRGDKFAQYRLLPSLQDYVLADPDAHRVEVFHRDEQGHWTYEVVEGEGEVRFASINATLTLATIFEDVPLPEIAAADAMPITTESNG